MRKYLLLLFAAGLALGVKAQQFATPEIGIVSGMEHDSLLRAAGYCCLVENTQRLFSPLEIADAEFEILLDKIKLLDVPLLATNIFIPGHLKVVGPDVNEDALLAYVKKVFQRGKRAGISLIIWGSGGSRRVPDGFDHARAREQFISISRKIAAQAKEHNIVLALESLNRREVNFINTLAEAHEIVKAVNHENLRLCADFYHMLKEGESPESIVSAGQYIVYAEVAEKEGRTPPGVNGDDFQGYIAALKKIGYNGVIVIECRWNDLQSQAGPANRSLKNQVEAVFLR